MAVEAYAATEQNNDKIHADVLTKARESCYKARDAFYSCIEKECSKKPTEIASVGLLYPIECKQSRDEFVKQCRSSWVKHFDRQYCRNKRTQRLLDDNGTRRGVWNLKIVCWPLSKIPTVHLFLVFRWVELGSGVLIWISFHHIWILNIALYAPYLNLEYCFTVLVFLASQWLNNLYSLPQDSLIIGNV